jgi:hypothetical protein
MAGRQSARFVWADCHSVVRRRWVGFGYDAGMQSFARQEMMPR